MNEVMSSINNAIMNKYKKTDNILNDVQDIIETSQREAYRSVNTILSQRNWLIGYRIAEEELAGEKRAEYGTEVIKKTVKRAEKSMERVIQKQTYIISTGFISVFRRFSTR